MRLTYIVIIMIMCNIIDKIIDSNKIDNTYKKDRQLINSNLVN